MGPDRVGTLRRGMVTVLSWFGTQSSGLLKFAGLEAGLLDRRRSRFESWGPPARLLIRERLWRVQVTSTCTHRPVPVWPHTNAANQTATTSPPAIGRAPSTTSTTSKPCAIEETHCHTFNSPLSASQHLPHTIHPTTYSPNAPSTAHQHLAARAQRATCRQRESTARVAGGCEGRDSDVRVLGFGTQSHLSDLTRSSTSGATGSHGVVLMLSLYVQYLQ